MVIFGDIEWLEVKRYLFSKPLFLSFEGGKRKEEEERGGDSSLLTSSTEGLSYYHFDEEIAAEDEPEVEAEGQQEGLGTCLLELLDASFRT